jgi:hypothetical protein
MQVDAIIKMKVGRRYLIFEARAVSAATPRIPS